jgi:hypothetical protein
MIIAWAAPPEPPETRSRAGFSAAYTIMFGLLGFCTLNPMPDLADGDLDKAVDLMIEEAQRCYHELGLRGAGELVPTHWYPHDPTLVRLWRVLADLGMYTVFHAGIFYDGRQSAYCRPAYFEAVRQAPGFKGYLAHGRWPNY